jgi:primase-polymerase (primpol)-like protein
MIYEEPVRGYPSHSEADIALINILVFWVGADPLRIERVFKRSGMHRRPITEARTTNNLTCAKVDPAAVHA